MPRIRRLCLLVGMVVSLLVAMVGGATAQSVPGETTDAQTELRDAPAWHEVKSTERAGRGQWFSGPDEQHPGDDGHLAGRRENVRLVGQVTVTPPVEPDPDDLADDEDALTGRIADVGVWGDWAWLGSFGQPVCEGGGVFTIDVSDPTNPVEITDAFIPAQPGTFVGEGVMVIDMDTPDFTGQVLIHNNEICDFSEPEADGGISLWDVTDPTDPQPLAENFGDSTTIGDFTFTHTYHSAFGWTMGDRAFVVGTDNEDFEMMDVDIFEITDPGDPVMIAETGMDDWDGFEVTGFGDMAMNHDMIVEQVGDRWLMLVSYWDGGHVILDVTDPANPEYLRQTLYDETEPFADELGLPDGFQPEGNAHQARFTFDQQFFFATDEYFNPYRLFGTITSGDFEGEGFPAVNAAFTPPVSEDEPLVGSTRFVGLACDGDPVPAPDGAAIAVIERGVCTFQEKLDNVEAAGYEAAIVFNHADGCEGVIVMGGDESAIPASFVSRTTGFKIIGAYDGSDPCEQLAPVPGEQGANVAVDTALFQAWGYIHMHDTETMERLGVFAIEEALDPDFAEGFGDLTVHKVAADPDANLIYSAYYSGGLRVLEYDDDGTIEQVGVYIHEDGNNFWGVEVHEVDGQKYLFASDRDSGLWIFEYIEPELRRLAGQTRIETAVEVSMSSFPHGSDTVVLARQDIYPDALAGGPLAFAEDAPILLTFTRDLAPAVAEEINRLGATNAILLGGTAALADSVVDQLVEQTDIARDDVTRIGGENRFATAAMVADRLGGESVYVAEGDHPDPRRGWPDPLAVAPLAAFQQQPILLTVRNNVPPQTIAALDGVEAATIVGGTVAVSAEAEAQIRAEVASVDRIAGATRYETATELAAAAEEAGMSPVSLWLATGEQFPDALVSGPAVAGEEGILLLTHPRTLDNSPPTGEYISGHAEIIRRVTLLGGTEAISEQVEREVRALLPQLP